MNRNLVFFSVFLILIGAGFDVYLVSFLGAILLIPALLSPTQLPARRTPPPARPPPRRIIPPTPKPAEPAPEAQPMTFAPMSTSMQYQGYSGALFALPMFPSLSQMGSTPPPMSQPPPGKPEPRDELLEVGAILAVLKLLSG